MTKTINFVSYNGWGHAIHGSTMSGPITDYGSWLSRLADKINQVTRKSVMVHCVDYPEIGDRVIWKVAQGIREAEIYDVKHCRDPKDMHTLYLKLKPQIGEPK